MGALYLIDKRLGKEKRPRGAMISSFFVLYFIGRFVVEFFKEFQPEESPDAALRMGQILSIPGILLGAYGLYWSFTRKIPVHWPHEEDEGSEDEAEEEDETDGEDEEEEGDEESDEGEPATADKDVDSEFDREGRLKRGVRDED